MPRGREVIGTGLYTWSSRMHQYLKIRLNTLRALRAVPPAMPRLLNLRLQLSTTAGVISFMWWPVNSCIALL